MAKTGGNVNVFIGKRLGLILTGLLVFILIPFIAMRMLLPSIPHMHYYFLGILFVLKILVFEDSAFAKRIEKELPELLGSNSKNDIFKISQKLVNGRNGLLVLTGGAIFILNFTL